MRFLELNINVPTVGMSAITTLRKELANLGTMECADRETQAGGHTKDQHFRGQNSRGLFSALEYGRWALKGRWLAFETLYDEGGAKAKAKESRPSRDRSRLHASGLWLM